MLNLAYWVLGQEFGGIFAGGATDPNAGALFVLLACAMWTLVPYQQRLGPATRNDVRSETMTTDVGPLDR